MQPDNHKIESESLVQLGNANAGGPVIDRRQFVASAGALAMAGPYGMTANLAGPSVPDLIRQENSRAGTGDWMLTRTGVDPATNYRCPRIEGYCSRTSVKAGQGISFHVSTNPPSTFTLEIFRTGYYGGAGGRHVLSLGPFQGVTQPDPPVGQNRILECQWEPCTE